MKTTRIGKYLGFNRSVKKERRASRWFSLPEKQFEPRPEFFKEVTLSSDYLKDLRVMSRESGNGRIKK